MKYAVIFGSSSGLAKATINKLLKEGFFVFGFDLANKEEIKEDNLYLGYCNVLDDESLIKTVEIVKKITDKVDVISNFIGMVRIGSLIELPLDALSKIFELNLNSTYKINHLYYQLVKNAKGRIINISSEYGKISAIPFHAYYPITKYGVEVYSDSLRRELQSSGIKVITIRPGAFKTNMQGGITSSFDTLFKETKLYKDELSKLKFMMDSELKNAKNPEIFANKYYKIATKKHVKKHYNIKNSFKMKLLTMLPSCIQDKIYAFIFK